MPEWTNLVVTMIWDRFLEAFKLGVAEMGEEAMRARFEESAVRLLTNIFKVGLFENPYLDVEETKANCRQ